MRNITTEFNRFIFENKNMRVIYHFTESVDSLDSILKGDTLESGAYNNRFGRGYDNISFTWNPNLWNIEYLGDTDSRYKVRISLDYDEMSKKYSFIPFDYGIEEEQEEIIEAEYIEPIIPYIREILISTEESISDAKYFIRKYPELKIRRVKRNKHR